MPCTRPSRTETLRQPKEGAPSRSWLVVAISSELATIATTSRLWQTSPSSLARLHACPKPRSKPLVCRRACRMAPMLPDGSPTKAGIALPAFRGESHLFSSRRSVPRPPFHARRCCTLSRRGMRRAVCRVCPDPPDPFLVGHSGVLKSFFFGCPRDPGAYPRVG